MPEGRVQLGHELVEIAPGLEKRYRLTFQTEQGLVWTEANHVIFTLPVHALRRISFRLTSNRLIQSMFNSVTIGSHTKIFLHFRRRPWEQHNHTGEIISSRGYQIFDSGFHQNNEGGLLTVFVGRALAEGEARLLVEQVIAELGLVIPGIGADLESYSFASHPHSYTSQLGVGESIRQNGLTHRIGGLFFSGEGFSQSQRGYMEGAIISAQATSRRVELEIFADCERKMLETTSLRLSGG
jgi:monoamine oxidase